MRRILFTVAVGLSLTGCSGLYTSPGVVAGPSAVGAVTVAEIDATSLAAANAAPYRPRTLPALFARSAGTGGSALGAGALPDPPLRPQDRPTALATRLPPPAAHGPYRLGIGDVVDLTVSDTALAGGAPQRQTLTLQDDGAIAVPDTGRVRLAGLSLEEAEAEVFQALIAKQRDPTFSLEITGFNARRIAVGGAVKQPQALPVTLRPLTLAGALAAVGDVTVKERSFAVIHLWRGGSLYQVPFSAYLTDARIQALPLLDGDALYVDTAYDLDRAQAYFAQQIQLASLRQSARSAQLDQLQAEVGLRRAELDEQRSNWRSRVELDAVDRDYVYIAGEVGLQNRFTLPFERRATLADALFKDARGVPNATGNIAELYLLRADAAGTGVTAWHLDARNAANLVLATRFELRPNDVLFVAEQPVTALDRLVSQITPALKVAGL